MLAPWKEIHDKPRQCIKNQRHHFAEKGPVVMYGCERKTTVKAEQQRIDDFALWCWRRLLRAPWTARRANLSILNEINPEYSLKGLMLNTLAT